MTDAEGHVHWLRHEAPSSETKRWAGDAEAGHREGQRQRRRRRAKAACWFARLQAATQLLRTCYAAATL
eukprot:scaffold10241_cov127-Isochrysis_galbana.AAC.4